MMAMSVTTVQQDVVFTSPQRHVPILTSAVISEEVIEGELLRNLPAPHGALSAHQLDAANTSERRVQVVWYCLTTSVIATRSEVFEEQR